MAASRSGIKAIFMRTLANAKRFLLIIGLSTFIFQVLVSAMLRNGMPVLQFFLFNSAEMTDAITHLDPLLIGKSAFNTVSYIFLHGGMDHYLSNMIFLIPAAMGVVYFTGVARGIRYYILMGVAACLAHYLLDIHSQTPILGASGSVFGMMGMFVAFRFRGMFSEVVAPIATMAAVFFTFKSIVELILVLTLVFFYPEKSDGVAHMAHVGGFAAGFLLGLYYHRAHHFRMPWKN